jgi:hypothetical protein
MNKLINFTEQNPSSEAESGADSQEITHVSWKPKVYYHFQMTSPTDPLLSHLNPIILKLYFFKIRVSIMPVILSTTMSSK